MKVFKSKSIKIFFIVLAFGVAEAIPCKAQKNIPTPVIFETDMGNDVDDGLALAMLFRYADQGKINFLGISNNKQSLSSLQFIDLMRRQYGYSQLPIATVQKGVEGEVEAKSFARRVMEYKEQGQLLYSSSIKNYSDVETAVHFYRRMLAKAKDTSVVIISVGFSTNLAKLLESKSDQYSKLNGLELVKRKVKFLSTMAGNFSTRRQKEFNVISDLPAARKIFNRWPTVIYVSPFEVGASVHFPASAIEANLGYRGNQPLVTAYKEYITMPYNRETWDLTSVLFAIEKSAHYFKQSVPGKFIVDEQGYTEFKEGDKGKHYFLHTPGESERSKIKNRFVELVMTANSRITELKSNIDVQGFQNPALKYRPLRIIHEHLDTTLIRNLKELGYGGVVTNVSYQDYLSSTQNWEKFRSDIAYAIDKLDLRIWIYDEKGYPSGAAGGIVLKDDPSAQALGLSVISKVVNKGKQLVIAFPHGHTKFLAAFAYPETGFGTNAIIDLRKYTDARGNLKWSAPKGKGNWKVQYFVQKPFYENTHATHNWFEQRKMVNLLEKKATADFIKVTHEQYKHHVGDYFGKGIEAFFTDEPSLVGTHFLNNKPPVTPGVRDQPDFNIPAFPTLNWSESLLTEFKRRRGYDLFNKLPYLVEGQSATAFKVRIDYYQTLMELVAECYFKPLEEFAAKNNVASSGHLLLEEDLFYHPIFEGSLMEMYKHMQFPGIDLLTAYPLIAKRWGVTTAKFASSVADTYGKKQVMSEISSAFDSNNAGINGQMAAVGIQFAYGVDRFNSYYRHDKMSVEENKQFTNYIGRVAYLLDQGKRQPQVAVYYPIESIWAKTLIPLSIGREHFDKEALFLSDNFTELGLALVDQHIDFNYIDREKLAEAGKEIKKLIIPKLAVLQKEQLDHLIRLAGQGINLYFQNTEVALLNGNGFELEAIDLREKFSAYNNIVFSDNLTQIASQISADTDSGYRIEAGTENIVALAKSGKAAEVYLFVNAADKAQDVKVTFKKSDKSLMVWDPVSGLVIPGNTRITNNGNVLELHLDKWQTLLVTIDK
ncbi:Inosine-uridine nucleoside N-ribohydrolase [Pedobacter sp. ok626]|uniref:glycosyl hydrolase n=1 Tax=Pedobacter sp. ok626 TaxID=1761882 RepID=UPI00088D156A|nr:glycosyl hydrolase [Pedobacter sp. ok626]SDK59233.1 Inosine-uridine nucleoside N-ribohydrolase [Pedobacter sp. ok626]